MTSARTLILVLATARLIRLVTRDKITEHLVIRHLRDRAVVHDAGTDHARPANLEAYVVEAADCPHCSGLWLSGFVLVGEALFGRNPLWRLFTGALALNYVTAHVSSRID